MKYIKKNFLSIFLLSLSLMVFQSCGPDKVPDKPVSGSGIFILNEGNFTWGNSSLSVYFPDSGYIQNHVFETANDAPLGDVGQSFFFHNNLIYVVLNNSGKILALDADNYSYQGKITGLVSPRYINIVSENKGYVSDLYDTSLHIIDPANFTISGYLPLGHSSEEMLFDDPWLYVLSWSFDSLITKIDTRSNEIVLQKSLRFQPNSMVSDADGRLWILSDGGYQGIPGGKRPAALQCIDPESLLPIKEFVFPVLSDAPVNLCIDQSSQRLYFLNGGIFSLAVDDDELPASALVEAGSRNFYSLFIDGNNHRIYAGDAASYVQDGSLFVFDLEGNQLDRVQVGVNPGFIGRQE